MTTPGSPDYVRPERRIATFDNDGTLWVEKPLYPQLAFAMDRVRALAGRHPKWKETPPFAAILSDDRAALAKLKLQDIVRVVVATHSGMTTEHFEETARDWLAKARHPRFDRPYTELVYQPMLEVLGYLRANGFRTYIVTGGGADFVRVFSDRVYGIRPEGVVGSRIKTEYRLQHGRGVLVRLPEVGFVDDGPGKPVGIGQQIGLRPIAAFGNSDGDLEMLQYTDGSRPRSLQVLIRHDDAERESASDADSVGSDESRAK